MEVTDLQIGDWVKVDDTENPYPLIVTEIYRKSTSYCVHLINNEHNEDITCVVDRVWAIPLTEDILKANGFVKGCYYTIRTKDYTLEICLEDNIPMYYRQKGGWQYVYSHPKYVHELQHKLRDAGLGELADNFKVAD